MEIWKYIAMIWCENTDGILYKHVLLCFTHQTISDNMKERRSLAFLLWSMLSSLTLAQVK